MAETVGEKPVLPCAGVPPLPQQSSPAEYEQCLGELPVTLQKCKQTNKDKYTRIIFLSYTSLGRLNCSGFLLKRSPVGSRLMNFPWRPDTGTRMWHRAPREI